MENEKFRMKCVVCSRFAREEFNVEFPGEVKMRELTDVIEMHAWCALRSFVQPQMNADEQWTSWAKECTIVNER